MGSFPAQDDSDNETPKRAILMGSEWYSKFTRLPGLKTSVNVPSLLAFLAPTTRGLNALKI